MKEILEGVIEGVIYCVAFDVTLRLSMKAADWALDKQYQAARKEASNA